MVKTLPISFRLEPSEKVALENAAQEEGRSVSNLLIKIVNEWLANRPKSGGD